MKYIALAFLLLVTPALAQEEERPSAVDVCLLVTGTRAQARVALLVLGFGQEMLHRDENGDWAITTANHHVAVDIWMKPLLERGTYDQDGNELTAPVFSSRPILRIRFLSRAAIKKARENIIEAGGLPVGLERVDCPTTRVWF